MIWNHSVTAILETWKYYGSEQFLKAHLLCLKSLSATVDFSQWDTHVFCNYRTDPFKIMFL